MKRTSNRNSRLHTIARSSAGFIILGLLLVHSGCGQSESHPLEDSSAEPLESAFIAPAVVVPEDAPALRDVYPTLSSGALRLARLVDLPETILMQAEGMSITVSDLEHELSQAPSDMRDQMRANAFFFLEQKATIELLTSIAGRKFKDDDLQEDQLLPLYFEELSSGLTVSDLEIESFYQENSSLMGNRPLEEVKVPIRGHLLQQKQQEAVENHIAELGSELTIALSAKWVKEHASLAMDNPVDQARASGKPTFVSFGADTCIPCQQMKPFRVDIAKKYGERLNVVYVHVNKDQILASRFGVRGIPHIIFFDAEGKQAFAHTGFMPQEQLEAQIQTLGVQL